MESSPARLRLPASMSLRLVLDICRELAHRRQPCRVTCTPPRCRRPRPVDCHIDSVGTGERVNLRPMFSRDYLAVPIDRVQRVELLR